jgi:hypothetical protein
MALRMRSARAAKRALADPLDRDAQIEAVRARNELKAELAAQRLTATLDGVSITDEDARRLHAIVDNAAAVPA